MKSQIPVIPGYRPVSRMPGRRIYGRPVVGAGQGSAAARVAAVLERSAIELRAVESLPEAEAVESIDTSGPVAQDVLLHLSEGRSTIRLIGSRVSSPIGGSRGIGYLAAWRYVLALQAAGLAWTGTDGRNRMVAGVTT